MLSWSDAEDLGGPLGAILAEIDRPGKRRFVLFRMWSGRAWQPLCVVSCAPVRGMARLESFLDEMGFPHVFHDEVGTSYWTDLQASLDRVLERRAWLVNLFADALDSRDPKVVRALATLVLADNPIVTVRRWASHQGMGYRELEDLTSDRGLPSPKHLLDRVRMGLAVVYACVDHNPSREELARRLRYSSGDYLGRQAKRLTGLPFGVLVHRGVPATMRALFPPSGDEASPSGSQTR